MNATKTANDAELIQSNHYDLELRHAKNRSQTWPGFDSTCPLDRPGYWIGTYVRHTYVSTSLKQAMEEWVYRNPQETR